MSLGPNGWSDSLEFEPKILECDTLTDRAPLPKNNAKANYLIKNIVNYICKIV